MKVRIKHYKALKKVDPDPYLTNRGKPSDDNIFTFDIETISLYYIDGSWRPFDYSRPPEFYEECDKAAACYIWQFGVNDQVYYGRELSEFGEVLKLISNPYCTRYIYIHNLSYEMQFLFDVFKENGWKIEELCARNLRAPIQFFLPELNIYFRCSYMLTNLSLENAAKKYTNIRKAVGNLDYNIPYSPLSPLNKKILYYCQMDCLTLYEIIKHFRDEYLHIKKIPLTQTGCVRKSMRDELGFWYIKENQKKVPTMPVYLALMTAFQGGISHGNVLYIGQILKDVWSFDFCSSYPYTLCCFEYPCGAFHLIHNKMVEKYKKTHALLYHVRFKNLRSKYYNHYIPFSKLTNIDTVDRCVDNGRLVYLNGSCEMIITDIDLELIKECYDCEVEYIRVWAATKKRLRKEVVEFILKRYSGKTTLKGVSGQEVFYMKMKQEVNAIFGMSCTNPLKSGIFLSGPDQDEWNAHPSDDFDFIRKTLDDMKKSYSTLFYPMAIGCWCTAYARRNLWKAVMKLDSDVAYYDTDSIKGTGEAVYQVVEEYNKEVDQILMDTSEALELPIELFRPEDPKGIEHPLGYFENETEKGLFQKMKVLGAKKYYYVDHKGKNHLTMAGVRKAAVKYISIDEFENGFKFGYKETGKLIHFYNNHQPDFTYKDIDGNMYTCKQKHSIILQPTTFTIGMTEEFLKLILKYKEGYIEDEA